MSLQDRIERPADPSAPKVLDLQKCQKFIRSAQSYGRFPLGDVIQDIADQLKCALDELGAVGTKIVNAQNEALRYQKESETANAEVRTMQTMLATAREDLRKANEEVAELNGKLDTAAPNPVVTNAAASPQTTVEQPKAKRTRRAKIVSIASAQ